MRGILAAMIFTALGAQAHAATVYEFSVPCLGSCGTVGAGAGDLASVSMTLDGTGFAPDTLIADGALHGFSFSGGTFELTFPEFADHLFGGFWGATVEQLPNFQFTASDVQIAFPIVTPARGRLIELFHGYETIFDADFNDIGVAKTISAITSFDGACLAPGCQGSTRGTASHFLTQTPVPSPAHVPIPAAGLLLPFGVAALFAARGVGYARAPNGRARGRG